MPQVQYFVKVNMPKSRNRMKLLNAISIFFSLLLLFGCQTKEEKAERIIVDRINELAYGNFRYEIIERSTVDSSFMSPYRDSVILSYAKSAKEYSDIIEKNRDIFLTTSLEILSLTNEHSYFATAKINSLSIKFNESKLILDEYKPKYEEVKTLIKKRDSFILDKDKFNGWEAVYRYSIFDENNKCDTVGYLYVFDKNVSRILIEKKVDSELTNLFYEIYSAIDNTETEK